MGITEYTYAIDRSEGSQWKTYVAKITGSDPDYILQREFETIQFQRTWYGHSCSSVLQNGLYEIAINRFDNDSGDRTERKRWWIIVADGAVYEYEFQEINWQYALYTSYILQLQFHTAQ